MISVASFVVNNHVIIRPDVETFFTSAFCKPASELTQSFHEIAIHLQKFTPKIWSHLFC